MCLVFFTTIMPHSNQVGGDYVAGTSAYKQKGGKYKTGRSSYNEKGGRYSTRTSAYKQKGGTYSTGKASYKQKGGAKRKKSRNRNVRQLAKGYRTKKGGSFMATGAGIATGLACGTLAPQIFDII